MTGWSSSHFLQSLGWAVLNSFWQMALLWIVYMAVNNLFKLSASKKYQLSVLGVAAGFGWFVATLLYYLQSSPVSTVSFFNQAISESNSLLHTVLLAASSAYLALLIFPSYKLYRNWRFVQGIKKQGLSKIDFGYRLFVKKIGAQLGIGQQVKLYASALVKSPVTVGYLKPMILIPVAALNNLSVQQVEAILLHELSHIRRFDYLVNFMVSIINTLLYFNPFVRLFTNTIEEERENCCDELVLQFGYDKVGYAAALLTLEKLSVQHQALALCARGKNYLLSRIEKIVGLEKKKGFRLNHFTGLLAALFCIVMLNSVLIIREKKTAARHVAVDYNPGNAFSFFEPMEESNRPMVVPETISGPIAGVNASYNEEDNGSVTIDIISYDYLPAPVEQPEPAADPGFIHAASDEIDASLTQEEKEKVKKAVSTTKKIISALEWGQLEKEIADAMTEEEKAKAREEYDKAFEQRIGLKNLEKSLKAQYESLNWEQINSNMTMAMTNLALDSLEKLYSTVLVQLEKAETVARGVVAATPMPDQSLDEIRMSADELRRQMEVIREARSPKKVIRL